MQREVITETAFWQFQKSAFQQVKSIVAAKLDRNGIRNAAHVADVAAHLCSLNPDLPGLVAEYVGTGRVGQAADVVELRLEELRKADPPLFQGDPGKLGYRTLLIAAGNISDERAFFTSEQSDVDTRRRGAYSARHVILARGGTPPDVEVESWSTPSEAA